jgi:nucleoside-diphosphate-sugar epimerase
MTVFTIVGSAGYIGTALADRLQAIGHTVGRADRKTNLFSRPLGHIIFAAGITADFRARPAETVEAHVSLLSNVLQRAEFTSLLYLSSTRVYRRSTSGYESSLFSFCPEDPEDLYNLSKALGESLCLARPDPQIRVARLANVIGEGNMSPSFFESLLRDACRNRRLRFESAPSSAKDFVSLLDVVSVLPEIAVRGKERLYNVASGIAISNAEIAALFESVGIDVEFTGNSSTQIFPAISIRRLQREFAFVPEPVLMVMRSMINKRFGLDD